MIDAPVVVLKGSRITVDGVPAGDVSTIEAAQRIQRIDELFDLLKAKRERWKDVHPNTPSPGQDILRFDPNVKAVVVKSVFQTAAFAGYPNANFMVRSIPGSGPSRVARLAADAQMPAEFPNARERVLHERILHVAVAEEKFVLIWKQAGVVFATVDIPRQATLTRVGDTDALRFPELASKISKEWQANGEHRAATDRRWDQAVVHVPDDTEYKILIAVIDAIYTPKRPLMVEGKPEPLPAFNVTLAM